MDIAVVILAAGEGIRMKSDQPKVIHPICGKPMVNYVVDAAKQLKPKKLILVVGHKKGLVASALESASKDVAKYVVQRKQLGTAHAVLSTKSTLGSFKGTTVVLNGDVPLISVKIIRNLIRIHVRSRAQATVLTTCLDNPAGYGRIVRNRGGQIVRIVEEKDATSEEQKIDEINTGTYCFNTKELFSALAKVKRVNEQKEYYLTDVIEILRSGGKRVFASRTSSSKEVLGINSKRELARTEEDLRKQINIKWMGKGVTITDPQSTFIERDAVIGKETTLLPFCFIEGKTKVGKGCIIGPMTRLIDAIIDDGTEIQMSLVKDSKIGKDAKVGPFCHIRPQTVVEQGAKVGSFVEVKKSTVGKMSKVPHLSYIGDATIGKDVNVGAGTITCNYNGIKKYQTIIDDGAFIGSDTQLVAPVKVGKDAVTGAGSVIADDVPEKSLALERCSQKTIKNWSKRKGRKRK